MKLPERQDSPDMDVTTFEEILDNQHPLPNITHPDIVLFSSLVISKDEVKVLLSMFRGGSCPPGIIKMAGDKSRCGMPKSAYSSFFDITKRDLIDNQVRVKCVNTTLTLTSRLNRMLNNDRRDAINLADMKAPIREFISDVTATSKSLTKLVAERISLPVDSKVPRRQALRRLQMEVKMRSLVALHFAEEALTLLDTKKLMNFREAQHFCDVLKNSISGLSFMINLHDTFN
jgi:hypothetical protein